MSTLLSSSSSPIQIVSVAFDHSPGVVGITICPGKKDGVKWNRDLDTDLDAIKEWGASAVVCLIEDHEFDILHVRDLPAGVVDRGMTWFHLPIKDVSTPTSEFEDLWADEGARVRQMIREGSRVLIHCRGGLGRAGMIAASLLIEFGEDPEVAIRSVRVARPGAIETAAQERWVRARTPTDDLPESSANPESVSSPVHYEQSDTASSSQVTSEERFRGCLLGGAVGDALGGPIEFDFLAQIRNRFGKDGIKDFAGGAGEITDDTQMTLFTAEGCIRAWHRMEDRGISSPKDAIEMAYQRWLATQAESAPDDAWWGDGWLMDVPEMNHRRAPGITCIGALKARSGDNDSKGCGGVMRVAPVGLWGAGEEDSAQIFELGADSARITHGHPSGYLSAGFLAVLISDLSSGAGLEASIKHAEGHLVVQPDHQEVLRAVNDARELALKGNPTAEGVESLGQGWVAEEALAIGLYCALVAKSFESGVTLAVNHGGDSDSTGSIAGQILGSILGVASIPNRWLNRLELRDTIDVISRDLHSISHGSRFELSHTALRHRYPPN